MTTHLSFQEEASFFMGEALREAHRAFIVGEVPVGAVLVYKKKIIARAHNQMEGKKDPTAHAELQVLRRGAQVLRDWRLLGTTLYVTLEPCSMCVGALLLARVKGLVWGAADHRHGANGSWVDLLNRDHPTHRVEVQRGLFEEEAGTLMRTFFQEQRKKHERANPRRTP